MSDEDIRRSAATLAGTGAGSYLGYLGSKGWAERAGTAAKDRAMGAALRQPREGTAPSRWDYSSTSAYRRALESHQHRGTQANLVRAVPGAAKKGRIAVRNRRAAGALAGATLLGGTAQHFFRDDVTKSLAELGEVSKKLSLKGFDPLRWKKARRSEKLWDSAARARDAGTGTEDNVRLSRRIAVRDRKEALQRTGIAATGAAASYGTYKLGGSNERKRYGIA